MSGGSQASAFQAALAARREHLNALFRHEGRRVDPAVFGRHLRDVVAPLVDAVAGSDAAAASPDADERALELTTALYRVSLRAHRLGLLGGERASPALSRVFATTLPALLPTFATRPRDLTLALANAALQLERLELARAERWLASIESLGPLCTDLDALFTLGLVLAWREGAAEFRAAAHERFGQLSPALRRAALGVEALSADPSRRFATPLESGPLGAPELITRLGGFVGFGGVFRDPPLVLAAEGRLFAFDSQCTTEIFVDAFGGTLRHVAEPPRDASGVGDETSAEAAVLDGQGGVRMGGEKARLPQLAGASSHAYVDGAMAVTLPHSHFVFIVGQRPAA